MKKNIFSEDDFDPEKVLPPIKEEDSTFESEANVREVGTKDGQQRIPEATAYAPSQFEMGILSRGETRVHKIAETAQEARARINKTLQPVISKMSSLNIRWRKLRDRLDARKEALGREFIVPVKATMHWGLILFLGIGEFPLNAIVFQMFGEPELMTYLMSSTLAVTIPLLAMFFGTHIRHSFSRRWSNWVIGILMPVSIGGALVAVTYVRGVYLVAGGNVADVANANSLALGYSIFALNLLVFSAAMVTSFFSHDPDEEMDNLRKDIVAMEKLRAPLLSQYSALASRMNAVLRVAKSRIESERAHTLSLIYLYRQANSAARSPNPTPMVFNKAPVLPEVPLWEPLTENPDDV